jgi:amino acid adenylation domain-containing protein
VKRSDEEVVALPASFGQERLWFVDQLDHGEPLYNVHFAVRMRGPLSADALAAAVQLVVDRHEALRTTLRAVDGRPRQVIAPRVVVATPVTDLTAVAVADRGATAVARAAEHAGTRFDLATGPLLSSELLRFADDDHAWLFTLHHVVCDGWSAELLFGEVSEAYQANVQQRAPALPELPLQYADFALWQRDEFAHGDLDGQLDHWRARLSGAQPLLALPTDHPRPSSQSHAGALVEVSVPEDVARALRALARRERATSFMALLAAFAVVLYRHTGTDDLVIGTAVGGRRRVELERLIGLFTNTVALRVDLAGNPSFRTLLARAREVVVDAQSHADVPFDQLVQAMRPDRDPSYHPVFQVMFDVQPGGTGMLRLPGVDCTDIRVLDRRISLFDFSVSVVDGPELRLVAEYATDLFTADTIGRLLTAYQVVLAEVARDPDRPVDSLPLMTRAEHDRVLALTDRRASAAPAGVLTELFARAAARRPGAPALHDAASGVGYSYGELQAWSGDVAARLHATGVRRGDVVALRCRRSPAAVAALLGVLRAGAAYLPLDPDSPPDRNAALLADAAPAAVLVTDDVSVLAAGDGAPVLTVGPAPPTVATAPPAVVVEPDDIAYVMYTSGSTGRPKAVLVPHRGVVNYVAADLAAYGLEPADRVLQFTALTFDVSAEEIFPCLAAGACLVIRAGDMTDTPEQFLADSGRLGITVMHLPTAYFHELTVECERGGLPEPSALRVVAIGGEATTPARIAAWRRVAPGVLLSNAYGPTESSIATTLATLSGAGTPRVDGRVPIGAPIAGAAVHVLDAELAPVPVGVTAEVYIGGTGLARGYLGRPDLTADRFVPNPFGVGERLYRSGDLARLLPDGQLEFCGRADAQVKIRGHRIEPAEVEAALSTLAEIRHSAVVARPTARGDLELVAYLEPARPPGHDSNSDVGSALPPWFVTDLERRLRERLAELLPSYLVPTGWVVVPKLPRTGTDKIDRTALPDAPPSRARTVGPQNEPRTSAERIVAAVWCEVLAVDRVGRDDEFFALGGHSLLAAQVVSRLRRHFGPEVRLRQVFELPRLAEFAAALPHCRTEPADTASPSTASGAALAGPASPAARSGMPVLRRASRDEMLAGIVEGVPPLTHRLTEGAPPARREEADRTQEP